MEKQLLLLAAATSYQTGVFSDAARRLGAPLTLATDRCRILDDSWGDRAITVRFEEIPWSLKQLQSRRFDGIAAVGDRPALLAAEAARALDLSFHSPDAARACQDKFLARTRYRAAGLRVPPFFLAGSPSDASRAPYPCVLKPLGLSASRGVIRVNNPREFEIAFARIRKMAGPQIQVEEYIPGGEFAVEAIVTHGRFQSLAIFDKPDPMEGPYFEETIYVTPSRQPVAVRQALIAAAEEGARALGLCHGPVHTELRYNRHGVWILEAHARPIGGLCAKALRFSGGMPLEELILRHALGEDVSRAVLAEGASGVMMIPIPKDGLYVGVEGVARAASVPGIEDVIVTAQPGQRLLRLPEGASYLGFVFARANSPEAVEAALRAAHAELRFHIATTLETFSPSS